MLSYILFCMRATDSKWNDPTTTTGKKTCSAINTGLFNMGMMDKVYHEVLMILVLFILCKNFSISKTSPCEIDIFLAKSISVISNCQEMPYIGIPINFILYFSPISPPFPDTGH